MSILVVPPQAGHSSMIVDYAPGHSFVRMCLENTDSEVFVVDYKPANYARRNEGFDALIDQLDECIVHIGSPVNLIGLCQAGWLGVIYAALYPEKIKHLVIAGAPIDFRAGNSKITQMVDTLPMAFFRSLVTIGGGIQLGENQILGFKMLAPYDHFCGKYFGLYNNLDNEGYVERYRRFEDWYEWPSNLAGGWYLRSIEELFKKNKLIKGELFVKDEHIDLGKITCPVTLIAGEKDDITLPEQMFNAKKYLTKAEKVTKILIEGAGHIAVFMGRKALSEIWPPVLKALK